MKAHYLPQFYLRDFTDPETPTGQEPFVWIHEPGVEGWKKRAPRNVAWERDYYIVTDEKGVESDAIEQAMSGIETAAARIINRLIAEERPFGPEDRLSLATFVALMNSRTPMHHAQIRKFHDDMASITRQLAAQYGAEDPLAPKAGDAAAVERAKRSEIIRVSFATIEAQARIIASMCWQIRVTGAPQFGTCDFPVSVLNPKIPRDSFWRPGLLQEDAMLVFPLTRTAALIARWIPPRFAYLPIAEDEDDAETINLASWTYGQHLFVAPKPDVPGAALLLETLSREREGPELPTVTDPPEAT